MTISYNWLHEYLPVKLEPQELSNILTSIGLEVESMERFEAVKNSLAGLKIGLVLTAEQHPNANRLKLTTVDIGLPEPLQIVCGAPNVAVGQTVVVAPVDTTIYPEGKEPMTMTIATIRGEKSYGMICAADEIGLGNDHSGVMVITEDIKPGTAAAEYFQPYSDIVYELGITPNRMDAMSHLGVARDVCAYLTHHRHQNFAVVSPFSRETDKSSVTSPIEVIVENQAACQRYSGVYIARVQIGSSPTWLVNRLKSIGVRSINNIVDITNFILHETGQPLHAFDADRIKGKKVIVKNLPEGSAFLALDEKERKLSAEDLMICDESDPMCIAGVFGGFTSGINANTVNVFLESAWFNPTDIRKSSFRHQLRTDAATRFEKGVDISGTLRVLKRAADLITQTAGGHIEGDFLDVYPNPKQETPITLKYAYLKKLSGKQYDPKSVSNVFDALGFKILEETEDSLTVSPPFSKTDISIPADLVEEVLRIDGFDNVTIPSAITITPAVSNGSAAIYKEKLSAYLTGAGFHELMTNSITNSEYYNETTLGSTVKMLNSLSANLNVMRPSMLESGLETIAFNLNRRNSDLMFYEFGRTYHTSGLGRYSETDHLALYITGNRTQDSWRSKAEKADFYFLKGIVAVLMQQLGIKLQPDHFVQKDDGSLSLKDICTISAVDPATLDRFHIKQPVFFADINWNQAMAETLAGRVSFTELPRQIPVRRDLAMIVSKDLGYESVEKLVHSLKIPRLQQVQLFDIFENEKIGAGKKSLAVSFTFLDKEKTLTEKEIDAMLSGIMSRLEKDLNAEIRK